MPPPPLVVELPVSEKLTSLGLWPRIRVLNQRGVVDDLERRSIKQSRLYSGISQIQQLLCIHYSDWSGKE
ncbi:hypothetical protein N7539_006483 [Penicillium diatomitis]|uniref:Uncharacterized protein n=1 Tax=Penicillium diatomitis TaxID=2819901 RepID=A0A9X0BSZ3_9EURO|nr:uncharacterized protein N7539_006483 [Penicillium diatomitis]KAJ5483037.1 hypothetical protein N7539_006483 [Penicillium diatomitis]